MCKTALWGTSIHLHNNISCIYGYLWPPTVSKMKYSLSLSTPLMEKVTTFISDPLIISKIYCAYKDVH